MAVSYDFTIHTRLCTGQMPDAPPFMGTAARSYTGAYSVLGYRSVFTDGWGGGGALPGGPRQIAGIVREPDASPAVGYTVRIYSQETGQLLAETTSGASGEFLFEDLDTELYYVVAIDQLAETWKAPIVDLITPALPP